MEEIKKAKVKINKWVTLLFTFYFTRLDYSPIDLTTY